MYSLMLEVGGKYNWKGQKERLVYLGIEISNGPWHQFAKIEDPEKVWCEVREHDLEGFEETIDPNEGTTAHNLGAEYIKHGLSKSQLKKQKAKEHNDEYVKRNSRKVDTQLDGTARERKPRPSGKAISIMALGGILAASGGQPGMDMYNDVLKRKR